MEEVVCFSNCYFVINHNGVRSIQCPTTGVTNAVVCAILCGMVHIKEPMLLIGKSSPYGGSGFPLSLSEWSFIMSDTI